MNHLSGIGWRCQVTPEDHVLSEFIFDVLIGADGKRNTLPGQSVTSELDRPKLGCCVCELSRLMNILHSPDLTVLFLSSGWNMKTSLISITSTYDSSIILSVAVAAKFEISFPLCLYYNIAENSCSRDNGVIVYC